MLIYLAKILSLSDFDEIRNFDLAKCLSLSLYKLEILLSWIVNFEIEVSPFRYCKRVYFANFASDYSDSFEPELNLWKFATAAKEVDFASLCLWIWVWTCNLSYRLTAIV